MDNDAAAADEAPRPGHAEPPPQEGVEECVKALLRDVQRLATYAVETGQLPDDIDIGDLYRARIRVERNEVLTDDEFRHVVRYYQLLEQHFPTITTQTLAATEPERPGRIRTSPAGRYLIKLWIGTALIVAAIVTTNLFQQLLPDEDILYQAMKLLEPFLYGAFGAFAYILRVTERRLLTREFDPARAPEHINRLVLGTLAGGAIILFIADLPETSDSVQVGGAALGFLAGYSVDFLFKTIERVISALLPKVETVTKTKQWPPHHDE
jgi:hypothetical protein